jgi:hypothetical protein
MPAAGSLPKAASSSAAAARSRSHGGSARSAGVDSIEHGQHLDPSLLGPMAAAGVALVPTLCAFGAAVAEVAAREPSERRDRWLAGTAAMGPGTPWPTLGVLDTPVRVILRGRVVG